MKLKSELDTIIATVIFLAAVSVSALSFRTINALETNSFTLASPLKSGNSDYLINRDNRCLGTVHIQLITKKIISLSGKGQVNLWIDDRPSIGDFHFAAKFNLLGQLFDFNANFDSSYLIARISLKNANPIKASFSLKIRDQTYQHNHTLRQPIIIIKTADHRYRIEYSNIPLIYKRLVTSLTGSLLQGVSFVDLSSPTSVQKCEQSDSSAIRLDAVQIFLNSITKDKNFTDNP